MTGNAAAWIDALRLLPHPEGGYYRETYRSAEAIPPAGLPDRFTGPRACSTAIYYLLEAGHCSRLHRIRSDEVWHFHAGDPLIVVELGATLRETRLGIDLATGAVPQHVVPAGAWFGACVAPGGRFSLVGCTVAPGFDFADFELADRDALLAAFPTQRAWIERLTQA